MQRNERETLTAEKRQLDQVRLKTYQSYSVLYDRLCAEANLGPEQLQVLAKYTSLVECPFSAHMSTKTNIYQCTGRELRALAPGLGIDGGTSEPVHREDGQLAPLVPDQTNTQGPDESWGASLFIPVHFIISGTSKKGTESFQLYEESFPTTISGSDPLNRFSRLVFCTSFHLRCASPGLYRFRFMSGLLYELSYKPEYIFILSTVVHFNDTPVDVLSNSLYLILPIRQIHCYIFGNVPLRLQHWSDHILNLVFFKAHLHIITLCVHIKLLVNDLKSGLAGSKRTSVWLHWGQENTQRGSDRMWWVTTATQENTLFCLDSFNDLIVSCCKRHLDPLLTVWNGKKVSVRFGLPPLSKKIKWSCILLITSEWTANKTAYRIQSSALNWFQCLMAITG